MCIYPQFTRLLLLSTNYDERTMVSQLSKVMVPFKGIANTQTSAYLNEVCLLNHSIAM